MEGEKEKLKEELDGNSNCTIELQKCDEETKVKVLEDFKKMKGFLLGFLIGYAICYGIKNESLMSLILIIVCLFTCILTMIEIENK